MFVFPHVLATLLVLHSPSPAPSATPPPDIAHVYTSDRVDETANDAARTTYVVTREQIVRNGYRTIAQTLQHVPGVEISTLGAFGSSMSYGIRGSSSPQVLVLIDGLPAPGSFSNSVELGNLPTTGVDRVEVVEGGGSTLYGTGAIGGIINIITQRSSATGATLRYGSFDDKELTVQTDHVQFTRAVARNDFGLPGGSVRPDSDYATTALHLNGDRRIGAFEAALRAGIEADHLGAPGPTSFLSPTSREDDLNENANLTLTRKTAQARTTVQFGGTDQRIRFGVQCRLGRKLFVFVSRAGYGKPRGRERAQRRRGRKRAAAVRHRPLARHRAFRHGKHGVSLAGNLAHRNEGLRAKRRIRAAAVRRSLGQRVRGTARASATARWAANFLPRPDSSCISRAMLL